MLAAAAPDIAPLGLRLPPWSALPFALTRLAPGFSVKATAEQAGVPMPSFFGDPFRRTLPILVPLIILLTLIVS